MGKNKQKFVTLVQDMDEKHFEFRSTIDKTNLPISNLEAYYNRLQLIDKYGTTVKSEFLVTAAEFNDMISGNPNADYMHVFLINDVINATNELGIVFRFSNIQKFDANNYNLATNEKAYYLQNGICSTFNAASKSFDTIKQELVANVGQTISNIPDANLTHYVTFDMEKIREFGLFEHDLIYELICLKIKNQFRLSFQVFIINKNRNPSSLSMGGYYDFGNLNP